MQEQETFQRSITFEDYCLTHAIERGYDLDEVIEKIQEFSDNALKWEEGEE